MKKLLLSSAILATFALFTACGDDVTEVHQDGMAVLDAGLELSKQKCGSENAGEMLYVTDSAMVFVCDGKTWQTLKGADGADGKDGVGKEGKPGEPGNDGTSCAAKSVENDAGLKGLEVTCGKTVVGTIWNGVDGNDGSDGDDGDDGESCTAKPVKNEAGVEGLEVTCGKTVVSTIWNGKDGVDGKPGVDGADGEDGKDLIAAPGTMGNFIDNRDGQVYKTVVIGTQTWMAENLNYAPKKEHLDSLGVYAWSGCYEDKADSCAKYGRLYTWEVAMDNANCAYDKSCSPGGTIRGVCPSGWHLPSSIEWQTLISYVGNEVGSDNVGTALKTAAGWYSQTGDEVDRDAYGFSALPAGYRRYYGGFYGAGYEADFWSSTGHNSYSAYYEYFYCSNSDVSEDDKDKNDAFSVRCIKD